MYYKEDNLNEQTPKMFVHLSSTYLIPSYPSMLTDKTGTTRGSKIYSYARADESLLLKKC